MCSFISPSLGVSSAPQGVQTFTFNFCKPLQHSDEMTSGIQFLEEYTAIFPSATQQEAQQAWWDRRNTTTIRLPLLGESGSMYDISEHIAYRPSSPSRFHSRRALNPTTRNFPVTLQPLRLPELITDENSPSEMKEQVVARIFRGHKKGCGGIGCMKPMHIQTS